MEEGIRGDNAAVLKTTDEWSCKTGMRLIGSIEPRRIKRGPSGYGQLLLLAALAHVE
jgi:hypothetical protein